MRSSLTLKRSFLKLCFNFQEFYNVDKDFQHSVLKIPTILLGLFLKQIFFLICSFTFLPKDFVEIY